MLRIAQYQFGSMKLYLSFNYLCAIYQESYALYVNNKIDLILGLKGI